MAATFTSEIQVSDNNAVYPGLFIVDSETVGMVFLDVAPSTQGIRLKLYSFTTSTFITDVQVYTSTDDLRYFTAVKFSDGNILINFTNYDNLPKPNGLFMIVQQDGTVVTSPTQYATGTTNSFRPERPILLNNGNALLVYGHSSDTHFVTIDSTGTEVVSEVTFDTSSNLQDSNPSLLSNGNWVVAYRIGTSSYFVIYDEDGGMIKGPTSYDATGQPYITSSFPMDSDGGFTLISRVGASINVYKFDSDGTLEDSNTGITGAFTNQVPVSMALIKNNRILITLAGADPSKYFISTSTGNIDTTETLYDATFDFTSGSSMYHGDGLKWGASSHVFIYSHDPGNTKYLAVADLFGTSLPAPSRYSKRLVAIADNQVFYEDTDGSMIAVTGAAVDATEAVDMFEGFQKVFVVNAFDPLDGTSGNHVLDFGNIRLHTTDILTPGNGYPNFSNLLTAASGAQIIVDYVALVGASATIDGACYIYGRRLSATTFATGDVLTGYNDAGETISFTLDADEVLPPLWYDWTPFGNITSATPTDHTFGEMPAKASIGCLYRGRTVLSGNPDAPNQWYMARQSNPWDWQYTDADAQTPVAGNNVEAGLVGDEVIGLAPYHDDYLLFGCESSVWILRGDPAAGGSLGPLTTSTGMFGPRSWCWDDKSNFYFLGTTGICRIPYGTIIGGGGIENLTENVLPDLMSKLAIGKNTHWVRMEYDRYRHGILISITQLDDGGNTNYWFDLRTSGFFPEDYNIADAAYSMFHYDSTDPTLKGLLLGCRDGYLRVYDDTKYSDDIGDSDVAIESYVSFAPKPLSQDVEYYGKLKALTFTIGTSSDTVYYKLFSGLYAEEVISKLEATTLAPEAIGSIVPAAGIQRTRERIKGSYMGLRVGNSALDQTWAMENIAGTIAQAGKL